MSTTVLIAFLATSVLLAVTPGPNMSLIIASTLSGGLRSGLVTLAGTGTGLAILSAIAAAGMSSIMVLMAPKRRIADSYSAHTCGGTSWSWVSMA